jgi:hypothetical protein
MYFPLLYVGIIMDTSGRRASETNANSSEHSFSEVSERNERNAVKSRIASQATVSKVSNWSFLESEMSFDRPSIPLTEI